jgi:hypothetical protein
MPAVPITIENLIDFYVEKFDSLIKDELGSEYIIRCYKVMTAEVQILSKMIVAVVVINRTNTVSIAINKDTYREDYVLEFYIGINTNESDLKRAVQEIIRYIQIKDFEMDLINNFSNVIGAICESWGIETNYDENYRFHIAKITVNFYVIRV